MTINPTVADATKPTLDHAALQNVLLRQAPWLLAYLNRQMSAALRRVFEPQDVLQDVFLEAFLRIKDFKADDDDALQRWLMTIARNRVVNLCISQRAGKRDFRRTWQVDSSNILDLLSQLAVYTRTPSQSALSHEAVRIVQKSINSLQPRVRRVIHCRYIERLSLRQTAEMLHEGEKAIDSLSRRGLQKLKTLIIREGHRP
jgi:RNA polymerase sigma factor (sigma-70 family)